MYHNECLGMSADSRILSFDVIRLDRNFSLTENFQKYQGTMKTFQFIFQFINLFQKRFSQSMTRTRNVDKIAEIIYEMIFYLYKSL